MATKLVESIGPETLNQLEADARKQAIVALIFEEIGVYDVDDRIQLIMATKIQKLLGTQWAQCDPQGEDAGSL